MVTVLTRVEPSRNEGMVMPSYCTSNRMTENVSSGDSNRLSSLMVTTRVRFR